MNHRNFVELLLCIFMLAGSRLAAAVETRAGILVLDPHTTVVAFKLAGSLHDTHGTFALRHGSLEMDPVSGAASGSFVVDAASGASGNSSRDQRMSHEILDSEHFPEIKFRPSRVDARQREDGTFQATIHGLLSLHGTDHEIDIDAGGQLENDHITARANFVIPYVAWGLTDPSLFLISVAKQVEIEATATGHVTWTSPTKEAE